MKKRWWCKDCQHENSYSPCPGCGKHKKVGKSGLFVGLALAVVASACQAAAPAEPYYYSCAQVKSGETCDGKKLEAFRYGRSNQIVFKFVAPEGQEIKYPNGVVTGRPITVYDYKSAYEIVYSVIDAVERGQAPTYSKVDVLCGPDVRLSCYGLVTTDTGVEPYAR